jgi:hypothetical protein
LVYVESGGGAKDSVVSTSNTINLNQWTHVAVVKQGSSINLYINGLASGNKSFDKNPSTDTLFVGYWKDHAGGGFNGKIDELRFWNTARSITDIRKDMYRTLQGNETGLVSYWPFEEGYGNTTNDNTGNHHGKMKNMGNSSWKSSTAPVPYHTVSNGNWEDNATWATGENMPANNWSRVEIKNNVTINNPIEILEISLDSNATLTIPSGNSVKITGK